MQITMNNGKLTQLFPGNGFLLNGHAFIYEKYEKELRDPGHEEEKPDLRTRL